MLSLTIQEDGCIKYMIQISGDSGRVIEVKSGDSFDLITLLDMVFENEQD